MISEGQEVFKEIHRHREAIKEFYRSPLGQLLVRYLNSEYEQQVDALLYSSNKKKDSELKGQAKAYFAIANLPEYLYSIELKPEVDEVDTKV
jgi:hypothetical protein